MPQGAQLLQRLHGLDGGWRQLGEQAQKARPVAVNAHMTQRRGARQAFEAAVGLAIIAVGVYHVVKGWAKKFLRDLEDEVAAPMTVAECRVRPLSDPMKMNGCAMVMVGAPKSTESAIAEVTTWLADNLGDAGAKARIWRA